MILDYIRLKNFRQYAGDQRIYFSKSRSSNITVIHGENGTGKTALLNAFSWCFYGKVDLPDPDILINEKVEAELENGEAAEILVELQFRDNNRDYTVTRKLLGKKENGKFTKDKEELKVIFIDETGKTVNPKNPQNTIDQILPEDMRTYFFFDGERIDNLSKKDGSDDIKKAIKNIMGLEVLERSVNHLDSVRRPFQDELEKYANSEMKEIIQQEKEIEQKRALLKTKLSEQRKNKKAYEEEKDAIDARLRELEGAKELQNQRDELEDLKKNFQENIKEKMAELKELCSKSGYLAFSLPAIMSVKSILDEKTNKGEIPAGIKQQFVDHLLENEKCICGQCLKEGTEFYENVKKWRNAAGTKELEDSFINTSAEVKILLQERENLFENIKKIRKDKEKLSVQLEGIKEKLDEISSKLDGKSTEEIGQLERRRKDLQALITETDQKIGEFINQISSLDKEESKLSAKKKEIEVEEDKAKLANKRLNVCIESRDLIRKIHDSLSHTVRKKIHSRINEVYSNFMRKGYVAELNENYELQIVKENDIERKVVAMSQGERQITSLAFIGALIDIAREQNEKENSNYFRGGIYPVVMDSPFGNLDPGHKSSIADGIPTLAHQVIVMVTDSQWNGEVEGKMRNRVGKEYDLVNYSPSKNNKIKYEYTEIRERL